MNRTDILNALATTLDLKRYLEIGVRNPADNFDKIVCEERTGVDKRMLCAPDAGRPWEMFNMTSDAFFERYPNRKFDLVFIDGNHSEEFARRDFYNARRAIDSSPNGRIVMHDCNPPDEKRTHGSLCGTVYRMFLEIRRNRDLNACCVDCDYGVGIVSRSPNYNLLEIFTVNYTYADLAAHRIEWLNLIAPENWNPL